MVKIFLIGHEDIETSLQGQGEALKVNELETALLVVTATVVTSSHYIKHLYYVWPLVALAKNLAKQ